MALTAQTGALLAVPFAAEAQQAGKIPIIGILTAAIQPDAGKANWSSTSRPPRLLASPSRRRCSPGRIR